MSESLNNINFDNMLAAKVSLCSILLAHVAPMLESHIPPLIMDMIQIVAWSGAIGTFIITFRNMRKKNKE